MVAGGLCAWPDCEEKSDSLPYPKIYNNLNTYQTNFILSWQVWQYGYLTWMGISSKVQRGGVGWKYSDLIPNEPLRSGLYLKMSRLSHDLYSVLI